MGPGPTCRINAASDNYLKLSLVKPAVYLNLAFSGVHAALNRIPLPYTSITQPRTTTVLFVRTELTDRRVNRP